MTKLTIGGMIYIDNKRNYCTICDDYGHDASDHPNQTEIYND